MLHFCLSQIDIFFSSPSNVNQVRQFNIVGLVRGVPLFPFSHGAVMTCQHGGSWVHFCLLWHTEVPRVGCHAPTVGTYGKLRQPHIEVLQAYDRPLDRGSTAPSTPYNSGSTRLAQGPP